MTKLQDTVRELLVNDPEPEDRFVVIEKTLIIQCAERIDELEKESQAKQAKIDALMFEYCPDDMTAKQIHDYGIAQHKKEGIDVPVFLRHGDNYEGEK